MSIHTKLMELHQFINRWSQEVANEYQVHDTTNLFLFPTDPNLVKGKLHESQRVLHGHYVSEDGKVAVEVHSQDPKSGLIVLEMVTSASPQERFQTMSPGIFKSLFKVADLETINKGHIRELFHLQSSQTEEEKQFHLKAREESFSWSSIEEATDEGAVKWRNLNQSLARRDWQELHADYLELFAMVFILGARLGYAPRDKFLTLLSGVFALMDFNEDAAQLTRKQYEMKGVETEQVLVKLYDPDFDIAPPETWYITVAARNQVVEGLQYKKGSFLPSSTSTHTPPVFPYLT